MATDGRPKITVETIEEYTIAAQITHHCMSSDIPRQDAVTGSTSGLHREGKTTGELLGDQT